MQMHTGRFYVSFPLNIKRGCLWVFYCSCSCIQEVNSVSLSLYEACLPVGLLLFMHLHIGSEFYVSFPLWGVPACGSATVLVAAYRKWILCFFPSMRRACLWSATVLVAAYRKCILCFFPLYEACLPVGLLLFMQLHTGSVFSVSFPLNIRRACLWVFYCSCSCIREVDSLFLSLYEACLPVGLLLFM